MKNVSELDFVKFCPVCGRKIEKPYVLSVSPTTNKLEGQRIVAQHIIEDIITKRSYTTSGGSSGISDSGSEEEDEEYRNLHHHDNIPFPIPPSGSLLDRIIRRIR